MKPQQTKNEKAVGYREFLKSLDLIGIALFRSELSVDRKAYFEKEDPELLVEWNCKPTDIKDDYFELTADFNAQITAKRADKTVLSIKAAYVLHFHIDQTAPKALIARYADSEIRFVLWPYFREYVSSACGRMHIPPIFLPLSGRKYRSPRVRKSSTGPAKASPAAAVSATGTKEK